MNKNIAIGIVVLILIIAGVWYYQNQKPVPVTGEPVKVGVIGPFAGPLASYGDEIKKGVAAADAQGLEFIYEDDQCEPAKALSAFKKLTELDKVQYIIGPACGAPQEVITPLIKDKELIAVVPSAASRDLYSRSGGNFYNVQYALEDEAAFIAKTMAEKGYKNVALITYENAFSKVHAESFKKNFSGTIVKELIFTDPAADPASEVLKLKGVKIDAIFSTDISFFFAQGMQRLAQHGVTVPVFSQYAVELPAVRQMVEGVSYSFPGELKGSEGAVAALSQDAAEVLGDAIRECNGVYACVKEELAKSGQFDETGVSTRSFILKQIKSGEAVEVK